jgi:hypothetical protein
MCEFLSELLRKDDLIPVIAIAGGVAVGAVWIVMGMVHAMVTSTAREKTKRELAAYVAAGTLDADKALAMLKADKSDGGGSCCV